MLVGVEPHPLGRLRLRLIDRLADPRDPQHLRQLLEELVARRRDQREVEVTVRGKARVHAAARAPLPRQRLVHPPQRLGRPARGGEPRSAGLDHQAGLVRRPHPAAVQIGDARAAVGAHLDQPLGGQSPQRLAHRRARHAELDRKILLMDARATRQRPGHDPLADRRVGQIDDARDRERLLLPAGRSVRQRHGGQHRSRTR